MKKKSLALQTRTSRDSTAATRRRARPRTMTAKGLKGRCSCCRGAQRTWARWGWRARGSRSCLRWKITRWSCTGRLWTTLRTGSRIWRASFSFLWGVAFSLSLARSGLCLSLCFAWRFFGVSVWLQLAKSDRLLLTDPSTCVRWFVLR